MKEPSADEGLVPYSSSDSDELDDGEQKDSPETKSEPPKLPCALSLLGERKPKEDENYSDPSLHNNRVRTFKHERGNWVTFVYIAVDESILEGIPDKCQEELKNIVDLEISTDFHISLSRTVVLQHHWIDKFMKLLENVSKSEVSFSVFLEQIEVYVNEEKTRTFLGFKVHSTKLTNLLQKIDAVVEDFKLPKFYEDPSFHISFAWCLGDQFDLIMKHFENLKVSIQSSIEKAMINAINVDELHCKSGNKFYSFKLNRPRKRNYMGDIAYKGKWSEKCEQIDLKEPQYENNSKRSYS